MKSAIVILLFCLGCGYCWSQATLLNQYLYSSNEDSILVDNFLYEHADYLIWVVGEDSESQSVINNAQELETLYGIHVIYLTQYTPSENIEQELENNPLSPNHRFQLSNYDLFYTGKPQLYFINNEKELVHQVSGFIFQNNVNQLINQYLVADYEPILDGLFVECLTDNQWCDSLEYLTFSKGQITKNNQSYTEIKQDQNRHLVRENADEHSIYYFREDLNEELVLYTFDYHICDSVLLYSVMTNSYHPVVITDQYYQGGMVHWVTDRTFNCDSDIYLEIISGIGTNAGLLPLINSESIRSTLHCQYQSGDITFSISECDPEKPNDQSIALYPNPSIDRITLVGRFSDISIDGLFDMQGRRVQLVLLDSKTVSTQDLSSGAYILRASVDGVSQYFQFVKM